MRTSGSGRGAATTRAAGSGLDPPRDPRRWVVLALASALFLISQFYRVANAVVAPELQRDLALSSEALGAMSAAFFYAFAAAQVPLAVLLDRAGARRIMTALTLVGAAGALVFADARGAGGATLGRVLLGVGMAGNLMGGLKLVSRWFAPREFATLSGLILAVGTVGTMLAATPLALLVGAVGWRVSFVLVAVATVALAAAFWALVREAPAGRESPPPPRPEEPVSTRAMVATLLGSRDYWLISVGAFCRYGTFAAIQALWVGPWLVDVVALGPVAAANLILVMNVALVAGAPLGGWLSDRVLASRKRLALIGLGSLAAAELALAFVGPGAGVLAVALLLAVVGIASSFGQVVYAHVKDVMPERMSGMAMTGVNFFVMLGAAAYLHVMGWMLDRSALPDGSRTAAGYQAAFLLAGGSVAVAFLLYLMTRDSRPQARSSST
jgi:nitrate/nitrite transporter NarK